MPYYDTYVRNPLVSENQFRAMPPEAAALPTYNEVRSLLPRPKWAHHQSALNCYWKAWGLAFRNLRQPTPTNGFVANYIDTAFNDRLFMWDSAFILQFALYGRRAFNFQRTLDNLYAKQHPDGFICREIDEGNGQDTFHRFDPTSTGPNIMPWCEWHYFLNMGDRERVARIFPVLVAYHQWLRAYRTWPDGSYWASGWACGMDNQPRLPPHFSPMFSHGHYTWADTCLQQILSAQTLLRMGEVLGRRRELEDMQREVEFLSRFVNERLWDEKTAFYYDRTPAGSLSDVKSIGAYWALLAGAVPPERSSAFVGHLDNPAEFRRPHRVPTLAADHPQYDPKGGYWLGSVWAPTNYMVMRGLEQAGQPALAHEIALNHLGNVVRVYEQTDTVWENYASESAAPGQPAKGDFVGWTGLPPIAVLLEFVLGIRPDAPSSRLVWDVRLLEEHGVSQYPFGKIGLLDLSCAMRTSAREKPVITVAANVPLELEVRWEGGKEVMQVPSRVGGVSGLPSA